MTSTPALTGTVVGVCAGRAAALTHGRRTVETAFVKTPIVGPVAIGPLGIAGDEHVYEDHGGPDMALLAYPVEHYDHWRSLGLELPDVGALGENLTVAGLRESDVHLGDVFSIGTSRVQVCQPRTPCYKLAARFGRKDMPMLVQDTGFTGYLLRVLQPGSIAAGDTVHLVERDDHGVTVAVAGRVVNVDRNDLATARRVLAVDSLGSSVRRKLQQRVDSGEHVGLDVDRLFLDGAAEADRS
ncbi:MAG: MOSC domain-containing protein [Acidimicrobiales bacterium]